MNLLCVYSFLHSGSSLLSHTRRTLVWVALAKFYRHRSYRVFERFCCCWRRQVKFTVQSIIIFPNSNSVKEGFFLVQHLVIGFRLLNQHKCPCFSTTPGLKDAARPVCVCTEIEAGPNIPASGVARACLSSRTRRPPFPFADFFCRPLLLASVLNSDFPPSLSPPPQSGETGG